MQVSSISAASSTYKVTPQIMTVAQALTALKLNSKLKISINDSSDNIKNNLNALKDVNTQITQITFKTADDKLNLNSAQLKSYSLLLSKVPDNSLVLTDNFDALNANLGILRDLNPKISKMILTPSNSPDA